MTEIDDRITALEARVAELEKRLERKRPAREAPMLHTWWDFDGALLSVRAYNVLMSEGVTNAEKLLALDPTAPMKWRQGGRVLTAQVVAAQAQLRAQYKPQGPAL